MVGDIKGDESEVSDLEAEAATTALIHQVAGRTIVGDERLFLNSKSGKLHSGRPGSMYKALCGENLENLIQQASGQLESTDNMCLRCFRPQ